jgi:hypothetical protein
MALSMNVIIVIIVVSLFCAAGLIEILIWSTIKLIAWRRNKALDAEMTRDIRLTEQGERGGRE